MRGSRFWSTTTHGSVKDQPETHRNRLSRLRREQLLFESCRIDKSHEYAGVHLQSLVHVPKRVLGLVKETPHDSLAEFTVLLAVVQLEDLRKCGAINPVSEVRHVGVVLLPRQMSCQLRGPKRRCRDGDFAGMSAEVTRVRRALSAFRNLGRRRGSRIM